MYALRRLTRSGPQAVARLSSKAIRPQPALRRPAALATSSWTPSFPRLTSSFHVSAIRREESDVKDELVAKLQNEITTEESAHEDEDLSANIREYLENSAFEIDDKPGHQEVILTRTFGDEKISVTFTTSDLNSNVPEENLQDAALYDGEVDDISEGQSGGASTKGAINQGVKGDGNVRVAPEDRIAPADREELDDEYEEDTQQQGFPAHAHIRIERPGKGALAIEATAEDGEFIVQDIFYFPVAEMADPQTAEIDWSRRTLYTGPPFNNLDEDLQILLEKYLEERGINTRMAVFIPDYIDHKEQKEYISWLNNVKNFIE